MAGLERVLALLAAPNAKPVVVHKTKAIAAIELLAYGDDTRLQPRYGRTLARRPNKMAMVIAQSWKYAIHIKRARSGDAVADDRSGDMDRG